MAQTSNNALGVDNTFRRKFDREEYLERARSAKDRRRSGKINPNQKAPRAKKAIET